MGWANDNAPIGYTCGDIDAVIGMITEASNEAEYLLRNPMEDSTTEARCILDKLYEAVEAIEEIRKANDTLRKWGNEEHGRAEDAEANFREAKMEKEAIEAEVEKLQSEVDDLDRQLAEAIR